MPPPILPDSQIPCVVEHGASSRNDQESGFAERTRNLEEMTNEGLENFLNTLCNEEGAENRRDIDSILSGTRTDGECSETEAISRPCFGVESNNGVVIPPPSHPHIPPDSYIPDFVELDESWNLWDCSSDKGIGKQNVEGMGDRKSEELLDWFHFDWTGDYTNSYYSSGTDKIQGTKYREDIDSIISGTITNTDVCSENEAISRVYESDDTVQRRGLFVFENSEAERKHHRSVSGALQASNQHMGSVPKPTIWKSVYNSGALSANLSMEDCNRKSHSSFTSSPLYQGNNLKVGESLPTFEANRSSFTGEGNTVEMVHSAPDMSLKETAHHTRRHNVADQREAHSSKSEKASEKDISYDSLSQHFGRPLDDARKSFGVSRTAFKTMCRDVGIARWKYGKRNMGRNSCKIRRRLNDEVPGETNFSSGMHPVQDTPVVSHTNQDLNKMMVKATYKSVHIRFRLPYSSGKSQLEDYVIKRLHLERNTFTIKYQDDDCEWVLIACDEDVQECIEISRLSKTTTIKMLIDRPVDHNAS